MAFLTKKICAFSILESIVSMVIVMIVFSLSTMVIINVSASGITKSKQNAITQVKTFRAKTLKENLFFDEDLKFGNVLVRKIMLDYQRSPELKVMLLEAYQNDKKLFETKELVVAR